MWISDPEKVKRFAAYIVLIFMFFSPSGCLTFKSQPESQKPPEPSKQEPAEVIPPEPPKPESSPLIERSRGKNQKGKPYEVGGKIYYPLLTVHGFEERGVASWYGPSFHGRKTSCGEVFDMHSVSAAHKLLPMYTKIEVTNLENGKSRSIIVNDRGPFVPGRILDLSYAAAKDLGMIDKGLARVLIRTSGKVEGQKNNDMIGKFFVHIGSFENKADALVLLEDMKSLKYKASTIKVIRADRDGDICWRIELGPYRSMSAANKAHSRTVRDYPSAFVVANDPVVTATN